MNFYNNYNHIYETIVDWSNPIVFYNDDTYEYLTTSIDFGTSGGAYLNNYLADMVAYINESRSHTPQSVRAFYCPSSGASQTHEGYFFTHQYIDYFQFKSVNGYQVTFSMLEYDSAYYGVTMGDAFTQDDSAYYLGINLNNAQSVVSYDYTFKSVSFSDNNQVINFDNRLVKDYIDYSSGNLFEFQLYRETLFRTSVLKLVSPALDDLSMSFSFSDVSTQDIIAGNQRAYDSGYVSGKSDGYTQGFADGSSGLTTGTADAFGYIGGAFDAVGGIMSIEVLPNLTLGLCLSIPLVLTIAVVLFKMFKK